MPQGDSRNRPGRNPGSQLKLKPQEAGGGGEGETSFHFQLQGGFMILSTLGPTVRPVLPVMAPLQTKLYPPPAWREESFLWTVFPTTSGGMEDMALGR